MLCLDLEDCRPTLQSRVCIGFEWIVPPAQGCERAGGGGAAAQTGGLGGGSAQGPGSRAGPARQPAGRGGRPGGLHPSHRGGRQVWHAAGARPAGGPACLSLPACQLRCCMLLWSALCFEGLLTTLFRWCPTASSYCLESLLRVIPVLWFPVPDVLRWCRRAVYNLSTRSSGFPLGLVPQQCCFISRM